MSVLRFFAQKINAPESALDAAFAAVFAATGGGVSGRSSCSGLLRVLQNAVGKKSEIKRGHHANSESDSQPKRDSA